jgi:alkane 1-monooxygenase
MNARRIKGGAAVQRARQTIKAAGFLLMLVIPFLGPAACSLGRWWLAPAVIFVGVPLADAVIGADRTNEAGRETRWRAYFWAIPHLYVVCWLGALACAADRLQHGAAGGDTAGLVLGIGIASAFATCAAHELLHRHGSLDQWAARVTMAMCAYGHFVVEHLHHHANLGRVECGTVPRVGESLWSFVLRNIGFGFRNAYRIAERMRKARALGWWRNRVVQQHALTLAFAVAFGLAWGLPGLLLFVAQAAIAMFTVELVQYFEHYGLVRDKDEQPGDSLAWNSNGWLTNAITLNIARHSDHHGNSSWPYQALQAREGAPQSPMGYFGLTWLALVPPLWFAAMEPLRARFRSAIVSGEI